MHTWKKEKKGEVEEKKNYFLQTEPTWEHKALSGTDSVLCARCKSILAEAPQKGVYQPTDTLVKELSLERSSYVFNHQPDAFRSGWAHQWLSGDLIGGNFSAHNH